jgi:hypothetical protein
MMEIYSEAADLKTAKLNEFVMVAHRIRKARRNARAPPPMGRKNLLAANGSIDPASPELCEAPAKPIPPRSGETIY